MLEKPSRGVIYTRKLFKQIEQIVLHQARWCNWLTRRPLKAESTGSSPVRAIKEYNGGGCREPPFSFIGYARETAKDSLPPETVRIIDHSLACKFPFEFADHKPTASSTKAFCSS
jgi:hypothetical protein